MSDKPKSAAAAKLPVATLIAVLLAAVGIILLCLGTFKDAESSGEEKVILRDAEYTAMLENRARSLVESVSGVYNAEVLLTWSGGFEYTYSTRGEVVCVTYPQVCGVAVVCRGGDSATVRQKLSELLSAAFDIPVSRISVAGKKE